MNRYYISHAQVMRYWRITLTPCNEKGYGSEHSPVFKGKTLEGAIKAAKRHCKSFKLKDENEEWFQVYAFKEVKYECDAWGREKHEINN